MKINKISNLEYELEAFEVIKHINYYKDLDIDSISLDFLNVIKPSRPVRILSAFLDKSLVPRSAKKILLIGYGAEDYITPCSNMTSYLLDVCENSKNIKNYIQDEAVNANKINKKFDCVLIGAASIELCDKSYFIQTIKNCLKISPVVITPIRTEELKGEAIIYKTNIGEYRLNEGNVYIYSKDNFDEFCSNFRKVEILARDCDIDKKNNNRCRLRIMIHE